jgi:hypothetical protein
MMDALVGEEATAVLMAAEVKFKEVPDNSAFQNAMQPGYDKHLGANTDLKPLVALIKNTD